MNTSATDSLWLVGSGPMAEAYVTVLRAIGLDFGVIGRGAASAAAFEKATGIAVVQGGVDAALSGHGAPARAIVATGVEGLGDTTLALLRAGTKSILVEKPAGMSSAEVTAIREEAQRCGASVFVGYNRRFYASVAAAQRAIEEDGGLELVTFDFTEMSDRIAPLVKGPGVKETWVLGNSSHVIDLVFHLAGMPRELHASQRGAMDWHPAAAVFAGSGVTERDVLFSYGADWNGPGRWGIELVTRKRRLILRPMERLSTTDAPLAAPEETALDLDLDTRFKPGLFRQVEAFLDGTPSPLCTIEEQERAVPVFERIAGYDTPA